MNVDDHPEGSASATGKLILSGEHAVVFGAPALAMGTRCRVRTRMASSGDAGVIFDLPVMEVHLTFSPEQLKTLHQRSLSQYRKFLDGETTIDGVPNGAAPVLLDFLDTAGSATGALLPTGGVGLAPGLTLGVGVGVVLVAMTGGVGRGPVAANVVSVLTLLLRHQWPLLLSSAQ